jgi:hypothetical protein
MRTMPLKKQSQFRLCRLGRGLGNVGRGDRTVKRSRLRSSFRKTADVRRGEPRDRPTLHDPVALRSSGLWPLPSRLCETKPIWKRRRQAAGIR